MKSEWLIENRGVAPDVEFDHRPDLVAAGHDPQLETAIKMVMDEIQKNPKQLPPPRPPLPPGPGL